MSTNASEQLSDDDLRLSGIPPRGKIGAAKNELLALGIAVFVLIVLALSFWIESRP